MDGEQVVSNLGVLKPLGGVIALGLAAAFGTIAQGMAIGKSVESIARQPDAKNDIRGAMLLGLVFIESLVLYALVIAFITLFV